jgi:hypothetical protein
MPRMYRRCRGPDRVVSVQPASLRPWTLATAGVAFGLCLLVLSRRGQAAGGLASSPQPSELQPAE